MRPCEARRGCVQIFSGQTFVREAALGMHRVFGVTARIFEILGGRVSAPVLLRGPCGALSGVNPRYHSSPREYPSLALRLLKGLT